MLSNGFIASCYSYEMCKSRLIKIEQDADGLLKVNGCLSGKSEIIEINDKPATICRGCRSATRDPKE